MASLCPLKQLTEAVSWTTNKSLEKYMFHIENDLLLKCSIHMLPQSPKFKVERSKNNYWNCLGCGSELLVNNELPLAFWSCAKLLSCKQQLVNWWKIVFYVTTLNVSINLQMNYHLFIYIKLLNISDWSELTKWVHALLVLHSSAI